MTIPQRLSASLFQYRWKLFAASLIGMAICGVVIFTARSNVGFALTGPLVLTPWGLMCVARTKHFLVSVFFIGLALLGLAWPFIVLLR